MDLVWLVVNNGLDSTLTSVILEIGLKWGFGISGSEKEILFAGLVDGDHLSKRASLPQ